MKGLGIFKITSDSWLGRKMFPKLRKQGNPATPPSSRQLAKSLGVKRMGRVTTVEHSAIVCSDGQTLPIHELTVVWCTGFRATYEFLETKATACVLDEGGFPIQSRGVATGVSGLDFVGLRFQRTFVSQDLYGVGQDAIHIADQITRQLATL